MFSFLVLGTLKAETSYISVFQLFCFGRSCKLKSQHAAMLLPNSATLPINILSQSFNNITNSYKFYWLWAILEHLQKHDRAQIALSDLALYMVSLVWHPLDFYKLSFGQQDSFKRVAQYLSSHLTIDNAPHAKPLIGQIYQKLQPADISNILKSNEIKTILKYVPYRFQSPFFVDELAGVNDASKNAKIVELARASSNFAKLYLVEFASICSKK